MDDDDNEEGNFMIEEDYYTFLNVSREATRDEINNAYRRLSRLYHPDKHTDPTHKKEAEVLFNKTKKAYEILSDPHKRAIYDSLGTRGLETEGWEIVQRTKTPQEIREEYEQLARQREERRLQQKTNPKGSFTVSVNATELFSEYEDDYLDLDDSLLPAIEITGMSISQSIEAPLTVTDTMTLSGNLSTHNSTGSGSFMVGARRVLSEKSWIEFDLSAGNGPLISFKCFHNLTRTIFGTFIPHIHFTNKGVQSGLEMSLAMRMDEHTMGYVTWRAGIISSLSTSVARNTETSHFNLMFQLGIPHSFASVNYAYKIRTRELRLRGAFKFGTFGALAEYGAEKKISEHNTLSAAVTVGVPTGVTLKIKLTRANQSYILPIHVCEEVMPSPIFYSTFAPLILYYVVKKLIVDPVVAEQEKRDKERQREANKKRMAERRREAETAIKLMAATFSRIRTDEETRKGLIIVKAFYGRLIANNEMGEPNSVPQDETIDVRVPLQCLVKDSKLILHEASKSQLPGFYDPCVGEDKCLFVQYLFHNHLHETTVGDKDSLMIPKQSHRVNPTPT
ncbi:dnaJ homolog subfamily C member 11 [Lycorma delicatula]|uniref:dnaJ homolog subfamily C member 11 n=1 Tax=Lycorma delicatula TaxID=130591 RepID=UPI003F5158B0